MNTIMTSWRSARVLLCRSFSSSSICLGRKGKEPFDKRFPVTGKIVNQWTKGAGDPKERNRYAANYGRTNYAAVQPTGIWIKKHGKTVFVPVPEMVPEFVVPDLEGFKLKPYVSYKVSEVVQSEFTAKQLFDACYAPQLSEDFQDGKMDLSKYQTPDEKH